MRVRTVLNHCYKFKSFVYKAERWEASDGKPYVVVDIEPRRNSQPAPCVRIDVASL